MSISEGYEQLRNRDFERAEQTFRRALDTSPVMSLAGLIRVRLSSNRAAEALKFAQSLYELDKSPTVMGLLGEAVGATGKRTEAEQWINQALEAEPANGWLIALRGEQRVRRGKWEDGARDLAASLTMTNGPQAFTHVVSVVSDLSRAVAAKRVEQEQALWLVDRILQLAQPHPQLAYLNVVRAAIAARQGVAVRGRPAPVYPLETSTVTRQERAVTGESSTHVASQQGTGATQQRRMQTHGPSREPLNAGQGMTRMPPLARLMAEDRAANAQLLSLVGTVGSSYWPSEHPKIDSIPSLRPQLLNIPMDAIRKSGVSLTSGSMDSEILISRGVETLTEYSTRGVARSIGFDLIGISQIEVQCLSGLLETLPAVPAVYDLNDQNVDVKPLTIGSYLGTVACKKAGGVWRLQDDVFQSWVEVNGEKFYPFKIAREWIAAKDKNDVSLTEPIMRLLAATGKLEHKRIADHTASLGPVAMRQRIAELWMSYFPPAAKYPLVEVMEKVEIITTDANVVIASIHSSLTPRFGRAFTPVAYIRSTGEFLLLPFRRHFGDFLNQFDLSLGTQLSAVLNAVEMYHLGGLRIIREGEGGPQLSKGNGNEMVLFRVQGVREQFALIHAPQDVRPWRLMIHQTPPPQRASGQAVQL